MASDKRRGKHVGRPHVLTDEQADAAARLIGAGRSWREVARAFKVSPTTLRDTIKRRMVKLQRRMDRKGGLQHDLEAYIEGLRPPTSPAAQG